MKWVKKTSILVYRQRGKVRKKFKIKNFKQSMLLFIVAICLTVPINGFAGNLKIEGLKILKGKPMIVHIVTHRRNLGVEPLMIRGVVIRKMPERNLTLVRIISETYRNRVIAIEGCLKTQKGQYVEGYFGKGNFVLRKKFLPFKGREK